MNERSEYFPREEILAEVNQALTAHKPGSIDWVTFVGSGETTLHTGIGWLIRQVKSISRLPVAVITNGSLLYQPQVRFDLSAADAVMPSLDAGNTRLYRKINRPHPGLGLDRLVDGLVAFRKEYQGKLWVEVMLVRDLNDSESALGEIAAALEHILPDEVHILKPDRPPAEGWVLPPDSEGLLRASTILGKVARVVNPANGSFNLSIAGSLVDAVIGIITRHPMQEEELVGALNNYSPNEVAVTLSELALKGRAQVVERYGNRFWSASPATYSDNQTLKDR